jgi:type I restriction-modification system DNA methylase subunit
MQNNQQRKPLAPTKVAQFISNINVINELSKDKPNHEILSGFQGFGGLKQCFWDKNLYGQLMRGIRNAFGRDNEKEVLESLRNSTNSAYYTPPEVIEFMYKYLQDVCNFKGGDILEPSCGNGAFFDYMPNDIRYNNKTTITAVEYDTLTATIVDKINGDIDVINQGLQDVDFKEQKFDLIIGNPPYSNEKINDKTMPDISGYSIHHYFIAKCVRLLKDDGILAFVMPSFFMDIPKGHTRHIIDNEAVLIDAIRLPDNLFNHATVTVDLVFIRKTGNKIHNFVDTAKLEHGEKSDNINQYWIDNPNRILGELKLKWVECYKRYVPTCTTQNKAQALKFLAVCDFKAETIENFNNIAKVSEKIKAESNNDFCVQSEVYELFLQLEEQEIELREYARVLNKRIDDIANIRNRIFELSEKVA